MPRRTTLAPVILGLFAALAAAASCTDKNEPARAPAATPVVVPPIASSSAAPVATATPEATIGGAVAAMEILTDNTVAIATATAVITIDAAGTVRRAPLARGATTKLDARAHGDAIVVEIKDSVAMLATPTLAQLWAGTGAALAKPHGAVATKATPATVYFVLGGALRRLDLPPGPPRTVDTLELTASKKLGVVTFAADDTSATAVAFDLGANKPTGAAEPMPSFAYPLRARLVGELQLALVDGSVVETDLVTGKSRKQKVCSDPSFANPILSPDGDLLVVTCGADGLGLDAKTFAVKRRYPKIMPGCDNGDVLPAHFDESAKRELVIEGCGGFARLDTTTAKYRCSDGKELVGAPYPGMSPGERLKANIPAERLRLPRCSADGSGLKAFLDDANRFYTEGEEDAPELVGPGGRVKLAPGVGTIAVSADESRVAYELPDRVVVRTFPAGAIVAELRR